MKLSPWPDWLANTWAKSSISNGQPGESLAKHTQLVLERFSDLAHLRPHLATYLDAPRLWHCLCWACFLHDFGKAAPGFQAMLRGGERWQRRHEVLSLVFLDWIAPTFSLVEQKWILAAIASHHKDQKEITCMYDSYAESGLVEEMVGSLSEETIRGLWRWLDECAASWIDQLNLSPFGVQAVSLVDEETALQMVREEGVKRTYEWLKKYRRFIEGLDTERNLRIVTTLVMLRGLTTTADHSASAHLQQVPQGIQSSWQLFAEKAFAEKQKTDPVVFHGHQLESAAQHHTSAMLIAPTGSGKTEAALFWALGDGNEATPRLFYTLPYQASMNAMYDRLRSPECFGEGNVGLQHGRALQALYQRLSEEESGPASTMQDTQWRINLNRLHAYPIKVFSPYQMLKTLYQIKGFEAALTDYTQAAFIFDEIHAYDANRLALILALVKHLRLQYGARFFIMSATFPAILRDIMKDVLGIQNPIVAEKSLFTDFQRHSLHLLDGELLTKGVEQIIKDVRQGKSVLICCNTVQRAQDMHSLLSQHLSSEQIELIHSRFIMRDRLKREKAIKDKCEVGVKRNGYGLAVVATQVVEVSLNIDLDTIYSDPAPLDALVQRFGRVNRARKKGIVPVYVFRQPCDGQYIYSEVLVQKTLAVLKKQNNNNIDEAAIGEWLDEIYSDPEIQVPWRQAFDAQCKLATKLLHASRPFNSDERLEEEFEKLFDGVDVLPRCFEREYIEYMAKDEFIEASQLFVSISQRKYQQLARQGKVRPMDDTTRKKWVVLQEYDPLLGLTFDTATPELNKEL